MGKFRALAIEEQENSERSGVLAAAVFRAILSVVVLLVPLGKAASSGGVVDLLLHPSSSGLGCLLRLRLDFFGGLHQRGAPGRAPGPDSELRRLRWRLL